MFLPLSKLTPMVRTVKTVVCNTGQVFDDIYDGHFLCRASVTGEVPYISNDVFSGTRIPIGISGTIVPEVRSSRRKSQNVGYCCPVTTHVRDVIR